MLLDATSDAPPRKTPQEVAAKAAVEVVVAAGESSTAYGDSFIALDSEEEGAGSASLAASLPASVAPAAPDNAPVAAAGGGDEAESLAADSVVSESISDYAGNAPPCCCCAWLLCVVEPWQRVCVSLMIERIAAGACSALVTRRRGLVH